MNEEIIVGEFKEFSTTNDCGSGYRESTDSCGCEQGEGSDGCGCSLE